MAAGASAADGGGDFQREKAFRDLVLSYQASALHAPSGGESGSGFTVALIPEFDYVSHGDARGVIDGTALKIASGTSKSYALTFIAGKQFTDWLKVSFLYKYSYTTYKAGLLVADQDNLSGTSDVSLASHLMGFIGNFTFPTAGNFEVSVMEAWDIYSGEETSYFVDNAGVAHESKRSAGSFDDRVFSLIVWWDKDFPVNGSWTVDPYLGWRTVQVVLNDMNDFTGPAGTLRSDSSVAHLAAGGLNLKYNAGPLSLKLRGGVNHRVTKNPIPGFASRANAPNEINLGYMSCWDRTVGTWGLGLSYVIPETMVFSVNYFGAAGPETVMHSATAAFVFLF
jgi:hypothetical protein